MRNRHGRLLVSAHPAPVSTSVKGPAVAAATIPAPRPESSQLVGRAGVLSALDDLTGALTNGGPGLASVTGPLGAGRSAVLNHAVTRARLRGLPVGLARCSPMEAEIPFAAVTQLLAGLCPPSRTAELATACVPDDHHGDSVPLLAEEFLTLAAHRPLLLAVDDLQWADPWSLRWFAETARRARHASILLIGSSHGPLSHHLGAGPLTGRSVAEFALTDLRAEETRELWGKLTGREIQLTVAAVAAEVTSGRPALLRAVADQFTAWNVPLDAGRIPQLNTVARTAWAERAERAVLALPADALALLRILAVGDDTFDFEVVSSLAGLRSGSLDDALAALLMSGLVIDRDAPRLATPSLAGTVLAAMTTAQRDALYLRAAELGRTVGTAAGTVADLLDATPASGLPWAGSALVEASVCRLRQGRPASATAALRRALREPMDGGDRARLLVRLASAEVVSTPQASDGRLRQVLVRHADDDSWPSVIQAADLLLSRGDAPTARRAIAELYRASSGSVPAAQLSPLAALGRLAQEETHTASEGPVVPLPAPAQPAVDAAQAAVLAWQLAARGEQRDRVRTLAGVAIATRPRPPAMCSIAASRALLCAGDIELAVDGLDSVIAEARGRDARATTVQALLHRADAALRRDRPDEGLRDLGTATVELPLDSWHPALRTRFVAGEIMTQLRCGNLDPARRAAARTLPTAADQGSGWAYLLYAKAELALADGDPGSALPLLEECGRLLRARRWKNPMLVTWRSTAALAHEMLGATETAARLRTEAHTELKRWGTVEVAARIRGTTLEMLTGFGVELPGLRGRNSISGLGSGAGLGSVSGSVSPERTALAMLSRPERDVARLLGRGLTNREIAEGLDVATRTVELRLTKIYRKLGIKGRAELAVLLPPAGGED